MNDALADDRYAARAERYRGLQPRVDDDQDQRSWFDDLPPHQQADAVVEYVRRFGLQFITDAIVDMDAQSVLNAYELGDGPTGALVRSCITSAVGPAIDRAVSRGEFEL